MQSLLTSLCTHVAWPASTVVGGGLLKGLPGPPPPGPPAPGPPDGPESLLLPGRLKRPGLLLGFLPASGWVRLVSLSPCVALQASPLLLPRPRRTGCCPIHGRVPQVCISW